jgi:hypothetical protein
MAKIGYAQRIKTRIQQLDALIKSAQLELDELRVAERVLGRLGGDDDVKGPDDGQNGTSTTREGTVADKAIASLSSLGPADTATILKDLQENWRSDLKQTTLASTLSRAKSEGRIVSIDGRWHIATETKEPPEGGSSSIGPDASTSEADVDMKDLL